MPSPSIFACSVLLISTESTRSDAMVSSLICRTPDSGEGMVMPSTMVLLRRGSGGSVVKKEYAQVVVRHPVASGAPGRGGGVENICGCESIMKRQKVSYARIGLQ